MTRPGFLRIPELSALRLCTLIFGSVLIFALCILDYEKRETGVGQALPPAGVVLLAAPRSGIVRSVDAQSGTSVSAGTIIARLSVSDAGEQGSAARQTLKFMEDEAAVAAASIATQREELALRVRHLTETQESLRQERSMALSQRTLIQQKLDIAERALSDAERVAERGFISRRELDGRRLTVLTSRQELVTLDVRREAIERELASVAQSISQARLEGHRQSLETSRLDAVTGARRVEGQVADEIAIATTIPGSVASIFRDVGSSVAAGDLIASILPEGGAVEARIYASGAAVAHLAVGDEVRLKFSAYPFRQYGAGRGIVREISSSPLPPQEVARLALTATGPVYLVRVADVVAPPRAPGDIRSGMQVTSEFVVERKRLITWFWSRTLGQV